MSEKRELVATLKGVMRREIVDPETGISREYFFGGIRSDLLKSLTFVPTLELGAKTYLQEDPENGYQRPGSATRMRAFGTYLLNNRVAVSPPIVLSSRNNWVFVSSKESDYGSLEIYGPAAIIDGQHRSGGYVWAYESAGYTRNVDFLLISGLDLEDEKREFLDINNTAKGVSKSITSFLIANDESVIANELNTNSSSPFFNKITVTRRAAYHLFSHNAVDTNVGRTFKHGAFLNLDLDTKYEIISRYWTEIADAFPVEWSDIEKPKNSEMEYKLLETTGLIAWSHAAEDILAPAFEPLTKTVNWDMVRSKLMFLAIDGMLDWSKTGEFRGQTGEVGGAKIHKKIQYCLAQMNGVVSESIESDESSE